MALLNDSLSIDMCHLSSDNMMAECIIDATVVQQAQFLRKKNHPYLQRYFCVLYWKS